MNTKSSSSAGVPKRAVPRTCPWWVGYLLLAPWRRWVQNPKRILAPHVREGSLVVEVGPGMGFFTLDAARLAGSSGRVIAIDVQRRLIAALRRRARRAGLAARIEARLVGPGEGLGLADVEERVDTVLALYVVHELPDARSFFAESYRALKPGGVLLFAEPPVHVGKADVEAALSAAHAAGFELRHGPRLSHPAVHVLAKPRC